MTSPPTAPAEAAARPHRSAAAAPAQRAARPHLSAAAPLGAAMRAAPRRGRA
jgi:hypothetical protein